MLKKCPKKAIIKFFLALFDGDAFLFPVELY